MAAGDLYVQVRGSGGEVCPALGCWCLWVWAGCCRSGGGGLSLSWGLSTPADYRCCGLGVPLGDLPTGAWLGGTLGGVYQLWVQPWGAHPVWVLQWPLHPS